MFCNQYWPTKSAALRAADGALNIVQCTTCSHVFNAEFDAERIEYAVGYENSLHFSPTFGSYVEELSARLIERYALRGKTILEIGCGDGDFLVMLCDKGGNRGFGFDPSQTDRQSSGANGSTVTIRSGYYDATTRVADADMICMRHVLEHLSDPASLLRSLGDMHRGRPGAIAYFEVPNGDFCLQPHGVWDLIYEHVSYFTPRSLAFLLRACGYRVLDMGLSFGEQFLWAEVALDGTGNGGVRAEAPGLSAEQIRHGYAAMVDTSRRTIEELAAAGRSMALWGAGSKGVTFLNVADSVRSIETVVDINPRKQSHHIALTGQKVIAPDGLTEVRPNTIFLMNSLYAKEVGATLDRLGVNAELISVHDLMKRPAA